MSVCVSVCLGADGTTRWGLRDSQWRPPESADSATLWGFPPKRADITTLWGLRDSQRRFRATSDDDPGPSQLSLPGGSWLKGSRCFAGVPGLGGWTSWGAPARQTPRTWRLRRQQGSQKWRGRRPKAAPTLLAPEAPGPGGLVGLGPGGREPPRKASPQNYVTYLCWWMGVTVARLATTCMAVEIPVFGEKFEPGPSIIFSVRFV